ncbi:hypothetical protein N752_02980 [Desulforamulus aquiferis]|nr:hypothetical protein N752_02980 [Desulforamulus aquiferis]
MMLQNTQVLTAAFQRLLWQVPWGCSWAEPIIIRESYPESLYGRGDFSIGKLSYRTGT